MKILVPIDGSTQSSDAIQGLAHFGPATEITLVHAIHLPDLDHPMITPELRDEVLTEVEKKHRREGERLLSDAKKGLPKTVSHVDTILQVGAPSQVILETAQAANSRLIMMGARGLGPIKEVLLGSVSHRVLLHAPCSLLILKGPMAPIRHILIPIEGQDDADRLLAFLTTLSFTHSVRITIMTVWPQPQLPWPITLGQNKLLEERAIEHAQEKVEHIATQLANTSFQVDTVIGMGNPSYAILEQAKAMNVDLIMVASHSRTGLARFLLGSVSHTLVHQSACPVMVVRSPT